VAKPRIRDHIHKAFATLGPRKSYVRQQVNNRGYAVEHLIAQGFANMAPDRTEILSGRSSDQDVQSFRSIAPAAMKCPLLTVTDGDGQRMITQMS
jgi:hypothetical protein